MAKTIYTAEATVTGGREEGHGRSSDGALDVQLRPPSGEGEPDGTNPEQLFAVGYAACFEGALAMVARRERMELGDVSIDSRVSLRSGENRSLGLAVELHVQLPGVEDASQANRLVQAAHQVCPYSNATRDNIEVTLTANGHPVGETLPQPGPSQQGHGDQGQREHADPQREAQEEKAQAEQEQEERKRRQQAEQARAEEEAEKGHSSDDEEESDERGGGSSQPQEDSDADSSVSEDSSGEGSHGSGSER